MSDKVYIPMDVVEMISQYSDYLPARVSREWNDALHEYHTIDMIIQKYGTWDNVIMNGYKVDVHTVMDNLDRIAYDIDRLAIVALYRSLTTSNGDAIIPRIEQYLGTNIRDHVRSTIAARYGTVAKAILSGDQYEKLVAIELLDDVVLPLAHESDEINTMHEYVGRHGDMDLYEHVYRLYIKSIHDGDSLINIMLGAIRGNQVDVVKRVIKDDPSIWEWNDELRETAIYMGNKAIIDLIENNMQ